ncbi:MAG: hypothetical protein ACJ76N_30160 [Thermoanaerobaculia bacterium]
MLKFLSRHAKLISLIGGFVFGTLGALWSFVVVDRQSEEIKRLSNQKADFANQVQSLNSISYDYFIANQQGDLIYILAQQGNARQDIAGLLYKGNVLDRATPVRNMLGALAIAKLLSYRQSYDAYEKINDAARADPGSFEKFTRLKQVEKNFITAGQERVPLLLNGMFETDKAINAAEAVQKRNRAIGLVSSILGSFLLLLANLIAKREKE